MTVFLGVVFALLLLAAATHAARTYRDLKATGVLDTPPKTGSKAQRARSTALRAPHTVRTIVTKGIVDDWVNRRQHRRDNPKPPREPLMRRILIPRGKPDPAPAVPPPATKPPDNVRPLIPKTAGGDVPQRPAPQADPRPRPQPVPPPSPERTPPVTTGTVNGTGAASDLFAAVSTITGHARSGGIRAKAMAMMTCAEGFAQQAAALEQLARDMQDAEYPAMVWEPLVTAAAHMRASGVSASESNSALNTILAMPARDLAASSIHVPHNAEFNRE